MPAAGLKKDRIEQPIVRDHFEFACESTYSLPERANQIVVINGW